MYSISFLHQIFNDPKVKHNHLTYLIILAALSHVNYFTKQKSPKLWNCIDTELPIYRIRCLKGIAFDIWVEYINQLLRS